MRAFKNFRERLIRDQSKGTLTEKEQFLYQVITECHIEIQSGLYGVPVSYREDFFQEFILKLLKNDTIQARYHERGGGYITIMLRNMKISYYRQESKKALLKEVLQLSNNTSPTHAMTTICELLEELPTLDKAIMEYYIKGYTHEDIADNVGKTASAVRNRISRAKKELKEILHSRKG